MTHINDLEGDEDTAVWFGQLLTEAGRIAKNADYKMALWPSVHRGMTLQRNRLYIDQFPQYGGDF